MNNIKEVMSTVIGSIITLISMGIGIVEYFSGNLFEWRVVTFVGVMLFIGLWLIFSTLSGIRTTLGQIGSVLIGRFSKVKSKKD